MMEQIKIYGFADEAGSSMDKQIAAMKRNGLSGLEIRSVESGNAVDMSLEEAKELKKRLDGEGLVVWSMGSPIGKIDIVKDDFDAHMERYRRALEVANVLGAKNLRMFSFYIPQGQDPAVYKDEVFARLSRLVEEAKGSGVQLCHENEKGIYGDMAVRCLEILEAFPEIRCVFDPANFIQCGQDTMEAWKMLKKYTYYMHIKDALANGSVVPAGCGIGNLKEITADFIAAGGCHFSMEPHLTRFEGLSELERKEQTSKIGHTYVYESADDAFDAACEAFRNVVKACGR
ncbi:MAG: sugar phosphate isomerase/epimerase [Lachnospiraceae bacterium]|nr:sugar phosphate isomerase/epimerase [Lachnospiraceae bacterium]